MYNCLLLLIESSLFEESSLKKCWEMDGWMPGDFVNVKKIGKIKYE
jgi:hypothetical protein